MSVVDRLLQLVWAERLDQIARWGDQHHPIIRESRRFSYMEKESLYKSIWEDQRVKREITWDVILLEEVYEALAETETTKQIKELIQVAAVALAMAEDLTREGN